jgi:hypothetical protein
MEKFMSGMPSVKSLSQVETPPILKRFDIPSVIMVMSTI